MYVHMYTRRLLEIKKISSLIERMRKFIFKLFLEDVLTLLSEVGTVYKRELDMYLFLNTW